MWYRAVRPVLFAFDPERAHRLVLEALQATSLGPSRELLSDPVTLMGLRFPNRVGLAAGFDKNAAAIDGLGSLGFGFIEVGTVTPRPQRGQARPRLFRVPKAGALINRLGFPNDGADLVAVRLRHRRYRGIVGVSIGKNAGTPIERAVDDYIACVRAVGLSADYIAINISSPNTESLRELHLQSQLGPLLGALLAERVAIVSKTGRPLPLLLKISPDLAADRLRDVAAIAQRLGIDGLIATNTTTQRDAGHGEHALQSGGLSGSPLRQIALDVVCALRALVGPRFPIVGVGGIDSAIAARAMHAAGADLVQIYTGLVYRGPTLVSKCVRALQRGGAQPRS